MTNTICGLLVTAALAGMVWLGVAITGKRTGAAAAWAQEPGAGRDAPEKDALEKARQKARERARQEAIERAKKDLVEGKDGVPAAKSAKEAGGDIDALEPEIQAALAELEAGFEARKKNGASWLAVDRTVEGARKANAALLKSCDQITETYDKKLLAPMKTLRQRLQEAPALYRAMAKEKRAKITPGGSEEARRLYEVMANLADSFAVKCEQRLKELFTPGSADIDVGKALEVSVAVDTVREMRRVHADFAEVLDAWPSALADQQVSAMIRQLSVYSEDLTRFSKGVSAMAEAMKAKAGEGK